METDDTVTVDAGEYRKYKAAYEDAHAQYRSAKYTDAQIDAMMEKRAEDARLELEALRRRAARTGARGQREGVGGRPHRVRAAGGDSRRHVQGGGA